MRQMCARTAKIIAASGSSGSRYGGLSVLVEEAPDRVVAGERVAGEPLDCATAGPGVAEGVPRGQQVRVLLLQLGFEPAEGALALDSPRQSPPGPLVADLIGEVRHVLIPDVGRQRIDADQVQLVKVNGGLAIDSGAGCPEHHFPGRWVDQPPVLVVG